MSISAPPQNLADVIARLEVAELSSTRRRDLVSATRRMATILDRPLERLPAKSADLGAALDAVHPEQLSPSITQKTWLNIRSNLMAALRESGASQGRDRSPLSSPWKELYAALPEKRQRDGLSRFVRYLSNKRIEPSSVNDSIVQEFMEWVGNNALLSERQLRDLHRRTTRLWGEAADTASGWPQTKLTVPTFKAPRRTVRLEALEPSLQAEVQAYLDWRAGIDPFNAPPRISRPITIRGTRDTLLLSISAYQRRDGRLDELQTLKDLVEPERVKLMLREYWVPGDGNGAKGKARVTAHRMAQVLFSLAQAYLKVEEQQLDALRTIKRQLGSQPGGMTPKNRATLRTFEDDRNKWLLLSLPETLWKEARSEKGSPDRMAVRAQLAIGLEILFIAPLRPHNLYDLRFGATLLKPGGDRGNWHVVLDEDQTKVAEPLEYELPAYLTNMIDAYREELRPALIKGDRDDGYLFPSRDGGCKRQETLAQQLTHIVLKRTGLRLTPHQHRHLAAQALLDEEPGNYIGVSHLLGHRNPKSSRMYTGLRTKAAGRHHERLVTEQRRRLSEKEGLRRRSPKKKPQSNTRRDKP